MDSGDDDMKVFLSIGLVAVLVLAVFYSIDKFGPVEPEEYWDLCFGHPGLPRSEVDDPPRDGTISRRELRHLRSVISRHDHRRCEELIQSP